MKTKYTKQDQSDWKRYEKVRESGAFNMLDPNAILLSGLPKERYFFILENYSEIKKEVEEGA